MGVKPKISRIYLSGPRCLAPGGGQVTRLQKRMELHKRKTALVVNGIKNGNPSLPQCRNESLDVLDGQATLSNQKRWNRKGGRLG